MKRATVTINDELEASLDAYMGQQEVSPSLTAVVQTALREYLARRGYDQKPKTFRIAPARKGSGYRDVSVRHDRYLAGD
jgi:metal-responsive CopG/Arc/MetJ family transcriptional regulator